MADTTYTSWTSHVRYHILKSTRSLKSDIFLISETKLSKSFLTPFRLDRSEFGGGLLLYVRSDIPCKQLPSQVFGKIECLSIEVNPHNKKWLLYGIYNPKKSEISNLLSIIAKMLDSPKYDNLILLGDFNSETHEESMSEFCEIFNLKNLGKEPTCFKSLVNPSLT